MIRKIQRQWQKVLWFFKNYRGINSQSFVVSREPGYNSDGLIVFNNNDCLSDPLFVKSYQRSLTVNDWRGIDGAKFDMRWRYFIVCFFANKVKNLEGEFVECGVYKGGYAMALMEYLNFPSLNKKFWLLDTYEGLAFDHLTEKEKASGLFEKYNKYEKCYDWVCQLFKGLPAEIIKGTVPETLPQCKAEKICYLSLDMNCVEPEIAAAHFFWDKIVPGGVVILDDYGFKGHEEQKAAFNEFAKQKNVPILQLPTGQGIIFKP